MLKDNKCTKVTVAGSAIGAVGSIMTVSTSGAVAGLGATGITSGLATIGGTIGGGMLAGLAITATAPIIAGATAFGLYKWLKK